MIRPSSAACATARRTRSTWAEVCTRRSASSETGSGSTGTTRPCSAGMSAARAVASARRRPWCSGWPHPVSWSEEASCIRKAVGRLGMPGGRYQRDGLGGLDLHSGCGRCRAAHGRGRGHPGHDQSCTSSPRGSPRSPRWAARPGTRTIGGGIRVARAAGRAPQSPRASRRSAGAATPAALSASRRRTRISSAFVRPAASSAPRASSPPPTRRTRPARSRGLGALR